MLTIRIIGGKHKGRKFSFPKNLPVRPTTDFVKESLFNILNNMIDIQETIVTDLFAGSGNISYEFSSRNAKEVRIVDKNYKCCEYIRKNTTLIGVNTLIFKQDALSFLQTNTLIPADIIFADPPYDWDYDALKRLTEYAIITKNLSPNGYFILEHSKKYNFSEYPHFLKTKIYGDSVISFFNQKK